MTVEKRICTKWIQSIARLLEAAAPEGNAETTLLGAAMFVKGAVPRNGHV